MDKNKIIAVVAGIAIIVVVSLVVVYTKKGGAPSGTSAPRVPGSAPVTRQDVSVKPADVPEVNATNTPKDIAVPKNVAPAAPTGDSKSRTFNISINADKFNPTTVIVNLGDTVHINLTAVDKDYDFFQPDYGLLLVLSKGQTKAAEFQASASGNFTFYCKSCGGPSKGPVGYLKVAEP